MKWEPEVGQQLGKPKCTSTMQMIPGQVQRVGLGLHPLAVETLVVGGVEAQGSIFRKSKASMIKGITLP